MKAGIIREENEEAERRKQENMRELEKQQQLREYLERTSDDDPFSEASGEIKL